jgi:Tetratricopeptide repeat
MRLFSFVVSTASVVASASALRATALAVTLLAASAGSAWADDYSDVNRLLRAGQLAEANTKADQFLSAKPRDPQMRFLKGVILTEQSKPAEAITTFTKLTEDYPELPEPYNNLAVLYAGQSQFDKARAALEMAIRTNPSYATAHENLGDVYAKLASQAYSKALQLDNTNAGVQPKLSLIRDLFSPANKGRPATTAPVVPTAAAATAVAPAVAVASKPVAVAAATSPATSPASATPVAAPAVVAKPAAPVASAAVAAKPAAAASVAAAAASLASGNDQDNVRNSVQAWAEAWSRRDVNGYLAAYGPSFDPPGSVGRKNWEEERKKRILGKNKINVKLSEIAININGNKAQARFKQDYSADALAVSSRKTLDLVKAGERWVIVKENSGT